LKKLKKLIIRKVKKLDENYETTEIEDKKATDFNFYITKKGKVCVCFGPYELGFGGYTKRVYVAGDNL